MCTTPHSVCLAPRNVHLSGQIWRIGVSVTQTIASLLNVILEHKEDQRVVYQQGALHVAVPLLSVWYLHHQDE